MSDPFPATAAEIERLEATLRDGLLGDTLPFWIRHAVDRDRGGFLFSLDRDGTVLDTDKPLWIHGRFTWLLATLVRLVEPRPQWQELARHGLDFLEQHGFDRDGRMFFLVTRDGRPLRKRRYLYTECFATMAFAAWAAATGDEAAARRALELFRLVVRFHTEPGLLDPKVLPATRRTKGLAMPMILLVTAQELREAVDDPLAEEWIDRTIAEIERDFVKPDLGAVLETVGPDGEVLDGFEGRMLCPGHALEAGWFVLREALHRGGDRRLVELGRRIVDDSWRRGWDEVNGGILYYVDVQGRPCTEYWHDMKFWWPHCEAILANLYAWRATGEALFFERFRQVFDWAHDHFPDPEHGEWFGYLHRDGQLSTSLKGNFFKGPFHLPRMQLLGWKLLEEITAG